MDSIDKLRDRDYRPGYRGEPTLEMLADEIEREIERDWMKLPVDMNGESIQIGDSLYSDEIKSQFMCRGMSLTLQSDSRKWWTIECWFDGCSGTSEYVSAKSCTHCHPLTVEDVLREYGRKYMEYCDYSGCMADAPSDPTDEYADKLREVLTDDR